MGKEKKEKKKVSVEQAMNYDETISFLEALLESFKARKVVVHGEEDCVTVVPSDEIQMEIKAKVKKDKVKMKMELSWREAAIADPEAILGKDDSKERPEEEIDAQAETADESVAETHTEVS